MKLKATLFIPSQLFFPVVSFALIAGCFTPENYNTDLYPDLDPHEREFYEGIQKAAARGNGDEQVRLGSMYFHGTGVPQDRAKAWHWWRLAASQGNLHAQSLTGEMYARRIEEYGLSSLSVEVDGWSGTPQEYQEAEDWLNLAAERGLPHAQFYLGVLYELDDDHHRAIEWYKLALDQNYEGAAGKVRSLEQAESARREAARKARIAAEKFRKAQVEERNRAAAKKALLERIANNSPRLKATIDKDGGARLRDLKTADEVLYLLAANSWVYTSDTKKLRIEVFLDQTTKHFVAKTATLVADRFDGYSYIFSKPSSVMQGEFTDTGRPYWAFHLTSEGQTYVLWEIENDILICRYELYGGSQGRIREKALSRGRSYARVFRGGVEANDQ